MKVLVTGASGLVGSALVPFLGAAGHEVTRLARGRPAPAAGGGSAGPWWDPATGDIDRAGLEGYDAVVHLAGEPIADGRWTAERKARIRDSRTAGTRLLCEALAGLARPPSALVSASAVGYYGDRGDRVLTEASGPGTGFLAGVAQEWERAAAPARQAGIRVVHPRIGMVLSPAGGALARLLPPFRAGLGGRLGSGRQWVSWIAIDDLVAALGHLLETEALEGPANAVAPHPVTNADFTRALGRVLGRPAFLAVPAVVLRRMFGEMADEVLLASARVTPARLLATGFRFRHPDLEGALRAVLGRPASC